MDTGNVQIQRYEPELKVERYSFLIHSKETRFGNCNFRANMGKSRNLKRRDNEVEGEGYGSNVTLSVMEIGRNSTEESDMGAWKGA